MALPSIMRKLFRNDGYGPLLKPEIIPLASDPASYAANEAASTKWVKDCLRSPVYVAPAGSGGSDANDGLSSSAPVASFSKAQEIAAAMGSAYCYIIAAAGTYNYDLDVTNKRCFLQLNGNVTINGSVIISNNADFITNDTDYSLTVTGGASGGTGIYVSLASAIMRCPVNISISRDINGLGVAANSSVYFKKTVTFSCSLSSVSSNAAVSINSGSKVTFSSKVTINPYFAIGVSVWVNSFCYFGNGIEETDGSITKYEGFRVLGGSVAYIGGSQSYIRGGTLTTNACKAEAHSLLMVECKLNIFYYGPSSGVILSVTQNSSFYYHSDNTLYFRSFTKNILASISAMQQSLVCLTFTGIMSTDFEYGGVTQGYFKADHASTIYVASTVSSIFGGNGHSGASTGPRVYIDRNSNIYAAGKALSSLPGNSDGTIAHGGYYG